MDEPPAAGCSPPIPLRNALNFAINKLDTLRSVGFFGRTRLRVFFFAAE